MLLDLCKQNKILISLKPQEAFNLWVLFILVLGFFAFNLVY